MRSIWQPFKGVRGNFSNEPPEGKNINKVIKFLTVKIC